MASNHLREIQAEGQAVWLDNISRALIEDGDLERLINEDGISGVTSNPSIFDKAFGDSDRYDDAIQRAAPRTARTRARSSSSSASATSATAATCCARPSTQTEGKDGYVSFELPPELADDADGSVEQAKLIRERIDRPNVLIKVPGTEAGVEAFEELTAAGVNVNVTLLFDVERYEEIAEAYVRGARAPRRRRRAGRPARSVGRELLRLPRGRQDRRQARRARPRGPQGQGRRGQRAHRLRVLPAASSPASAGRSCAAAGAAVQRPLWASTSIKNPDYPDTLYVDELIGPDTVNTMPDETIEAARDHATAARTVDKDVDGAHALLDELREAGVDVDDIVGRELVEEGVAVLRQVLRLDDRHDRGEGGRGHHLLRPRRAACESHPAQGEIRPVAVSRPDARAASPPRG